MKTVIREARYSNRYFARSFHRQSYWNAIGQSTSKVCISFVCILLLYSTSIETYNDISLDMRISLCLEITLLCFRKQLGERTVQPT
jgi:hypothetical protein